MSTVPAALSKEHDAPSVFEPGHLLREARRQKGLPERDVPHVCVLDPDGDLVRHLRATGQARPSLGWACYHTDLVEFTLADGTDAGVVGCAVGAPFAVLVNEGMAGQASCQEVSRSSRAEWGGRSNLPPELCSRGSMSAEGPER